MNVVESAQIVVETIDQGASSGLQKMEGQLATVDIAAQAASRAMAQLRENYARASAATGPVAGAAGGADTGGAAMSARFADFNETEKDVQRVLALMDTIPQRLLSLKEKGGLQQALLGAKNPATEIDAVAQRLDFLRTKMFLLTQASGKGWQDFRTQVNAATTMPQLTAIQTQMEQAGVKAGEAAPRFATLHTQVRGFLDDLAKAHPLMAGFVGGLAGMFAMQTIMTSVQKVKEFVTSVKELALAQRQLHVEGLETGLRVETLESYRVAAAETGVELGQLRMGMRMLAVNMEKHPEAFAKLGIAVKDARGEMRALDDVMPELSDVFAQMTNQTERLELASALMGGRMGARLLPLLTLGAERMRAFREEGVKLGIILDEKDDAALVRLAADTARADLAMEGINKHLKLELVPVWEQVAAVIIKAAQALMYFHTLYEKLRGGRKEGLEWWLDMGKSPLQKAADAGGNAMQMMRDWMQPPAPKAVNPLMSAHGQEPDAVTEAATRAREAIKLLMGDETAGKVDSLMEKLKRLGQTSTDIDRLAASFTGSRAQMEQWAKTYGEDTALKAAATALVMQRLRKEYGSMAETVYRATGAVVTGNESTEASVNKIREAWNNLMVVTGQSPVEAVRTRIRALDDELASGKKPLADYTREMGKLNEELLRASGIRGALVVPKEQRDKTWGRYLDTITKPVPKVPEPKALPEDENAWERGWLKLYRDIEDSEAKVSHLRDFTVNVVQGLGDALYQPFDKFLSRVFSSKSGWAQFWHTLSDMAIRELLRIAETKLLLFLANLFSGGLGGMLDSPIGTAGPTTLLASVAPVSPGTDMASLQKRGGGVTVINNNTVQTFTPRDVLLDLTSPNGSLRRANDSLALAAEY